MNRSAAKTVVDFSIMIWCSQLIGQLRFIWLVLLIKRINAVYLPRQKKEELDICRKDKRDRYKFLCLMNMGMPASIIRMPFLCLSFYFLKKKKSFNLTRRPAKVSFKGTSLFHFISQQRTNQLKIKESVLSNQFYQL